MKHLFIVAVLVALAGLARPLAAQTPPSTPSVTLKAEKYLGKLERIDEKQRTIAIRMDKELRVVQCAPDCRVFTTEGKLGKLTDLRPGTKVEVSCVETAGQLTAQRITPLEALGKDTRLTREKK